MHASLLKHRHLWLAVLLDRPGVPDYTEPDLLLTSGLIKLRDLPNNIWNADTLYILTELTPSPGNWPALPRKKIGQANPRLRGPEGDRPALGTGRRSTVGVGVVGLKCGRSRDPAFWASPAQPREDRQGDTVAKYPRGIAMQLITVKIDKPEETNFVLGQTHFIKSVEDIHEALVGAVPGIKFGLAFCEASGKCLVRWSGTDPAMVELAQKNAAGHRRRSLLHLFLGEGFYPLNVLNTVKMVPEVCHVFCATANPTEVILAETKQGAASSA